MGVGAGHRQRTLKLPQPVALTDEQRADPLAAWSVGPPGSTLARGRKGFAPLVRNYTTALATPGWWRRLAYDAFRDEVLWSPWDDSGSVAWRRWDNEDTTRAREALERAGFESAGAENVRAAVWRVAMDTVIDTAQTWLAGLTWDGVERVEGFLARYLGAADSPYNRAVSAYQWTAMAGRVLQPGVQCDMVMILYARGGFRKSGTAKAMCPDEDFYGRADLGKRDDDLSRVMRGKLVLELAELRGLSGRDSGALKDFISATTDEWVPKYKELPERHPRRFVWVGTTDKVDVLHDDAGNLRRWLPVVCGETLDQADTDALTADRDQLWAEARERFWGCVPGCAGGVAWRDAERLAKIELAAGLEAFVQEDTEEDALLDWLEGPSDDVPTAEGGGIVRTRGEAGFSLREAVLALGVPTHLVARQAHRVGGLLRALGYVKAQKGGTGADRGRMRWRKV